VPEGARGLVLRAAILGLNVVLRVVDLDDPFAAYRAAVTGVTSDGDALCLGLCRQGSVAGELPLLEVARGQAARLLVDAHHAHGAQAGKDGRTGLHVVIAEPVPESAHLVRLRGGWALGATHGDGLQPFGAHYGAQACAPGGPRSVVHDVRDAGQVLPRDAAHRHACPPLADVLPEAPFAVQRLQPPKMVGREERRLAVANPERDGPRAHTADDDHVPAGALQFGPKVPPALTRPEAAGER